MIPHRHLGPLLRRHARRGVTLVELLIVVALIALLSAAVVFGSGMLSSSRQRAAATLIVAGVRMGITRANSTGRPVRMVFDLEQERVMLEQSSGREMLREKEEANTGGGAEPATEAEKAAKAETTRVLEGPHTPRPRFAPVKQFGFDGDEGMGRELGKGIEFKSVQTEHDLEPRKEGRAYLYFFPGGGTERASIQLRKQGSDEGLTVLVSPLTGRASIKKGDVDLEEPRIDIEFGEREEDTP
jgi:general secretion pathway protein H